MEDGSTFARFVYLVFVAGDFAEDDVFCASWTVVIVTAVSFVFLQCCILVVCVLCIYASRGRARKEQQDDGASTAGSSSGGNSTVYRSAIGVGSSRDRFSAASRSGRSSVSLPHHHHHPGSSIYGGTLQSQPGSTTAAENSASTLKSLRTNLRD